MARLRSDGWQALVLWQCETSDSERLVARIHRFLGSDR
jgi:G:T-mismatch repair DNA endonuclease (very short patch repair protein)